MIEKLFKQCITALTVWYDVLCTIPSPVWKGFVVCILDGNTIRVVSKTSTKKVINVRLYGIKNPGKRKKRREKARLVLKEYLLSGDVVEIHPVETDSFGCVEALVIKNGVILNIEMIRRRQAFVVL